MAEHRPIADTSRPFLPAATGQSLILVGLTPRCIPLAGGVLAKALCPNVLFMLCFCARYSWSTRGRGAVK